MTPQALLCSVSTGLFFGIWPLISRVAKLSAIWTTSTVTTGMVIVVLAAMTKETQLPPMKNLLLGLSAGILSGFGLLTYGMLISRSDEWDMTVTIPISLIVTPMVLVAGGCFFFHDPLPPTKIIGGALGIAAIWMLCK